MNHYEYIIASLINTNVFLLFYNNYKGRYIRLFDYRFQCLN